MPQRTLVAANSGRSRRRSHRVHVGGETRKANVEAVVHLEDLLEVGAHSHGLHAKPSVTARSRGEGQAGAGERRSAGGRGQKNKNTPSQFSAKALQSPATAAARAAQASHRPWRPLSRGRGSGAHAGAAWSSRRDAHAALANHGNACRAVDLRRGLSEGSGEGRAAATRAGLGGVWRGNGPQDGLAGGCRGRLDIADGIPQRAGEQGAAPRRAPKRCTRAARSPPGGIHVRARRPVPARSPT